MYNDAEPYMLPVGMTEAEREQFVRRNIIIKVSTACLNAFYSFSDTVLISHDKNNYVESRRYERFLDPRIV